MPEHPAEFVPIIATALREWQQVELSKDFAVKAPTTLWIDKAEVPAQVVLDAIDKAGYVLVRKPDATGHFALRDKWVTACGRSLNAFGGTTDAAGVTCPQCLAYSEHNGRDADA